MERIRQDGIQNNLLNILLKFDFYCKKKDIDVILCGGTLLGAIRHKGFIPWDDDIDIYLTKKDFERLMKIAQQDYYIDKEQRYKILVPEVNPHYYPFIKIIDTTTVVFERNISKQLSVGLWIDVFCLSFWPNDIKESKHIVTQVHMLKNFNKIMISGNIVDFKYRLIYPFSWVLKKGLKMLGIDEIYFSKKLRLLDKYLDTEYVGNLCWTAGLKDRVHRNIFNELIEVEFENHLFKAPVGYKEYLTSMYGNYMSLPPVDKRTRHNFDAYYLDKKNDDISE